MANSWCYLFESKGIQKYILDSGRLKDLIGASDLVASISRSNESDLISDVLSISPVDDVEFSRRSGGSFCMHSGNREDLDRFRALWRLAVGLIAPGMPFTDCDPVAADGFNEALDKAYSSQSGIRENSPAFLPPTGGPMTLFNPRTGRIAVEKERRGDTVVYLDAITKAQVDRERALMKAPRDKAREDTLAQSFLPKDGTNDEYRFPRHFEIIDANRTNPAFPFEVSNPSRQWKADRRVAVVHADISGLGQIFRNVAAQARNPKKLFYVASKIEESIAFSARQASVDQVLPFSAKPGDRGYEALFGPETHNCPRVSIPPIRPVVLGGDDITVIVRADLAIGFTKTLLENIENETSRLFGPAGLFSEMNLKDVPEEGLTACAGVAVVSSGHPFLAAQNMAEGMCQYAKKIAKDGGEPYPSLMSFSVITSTVDEKFETEYREREHRTKDKQTQDKQSIKPLYLSGGAYGVGSHAAEHKSFDDLLRLTKVLKKIPGHGKLYESLSLRHDGPVAASRAWNRFLEVVSETKDLRVDLISAFSKVRGCDPDSESWPKMDKALPIVSDALELIDIGAAQDSEGCVG